MKRPDKKNLAASVHQRLLNQSKTAGRPFNELLHYYGIERLLYRLSQSPYRDQFALKGALIFMTWGAPLSRPTRDIDLLSNISNSVAEAVAIFKMVCAQPVEPDGLDFDTRSLVGSTIKASEEHPGVRLKFRGKLGAARLNMQIDVGFADVVTPRPTLVEYPVLLDMPRPRLRGYPRETVIAEKLHALVTLGMANTRLKDFYDLWVLSKDTEVDRALLRTAISRTFAHRHVELPSELPVGWSESFAREKQTQWQAFINTGRITVAPAELVEAIEAATKTFWPLLQHE